MSPGYDFHPEAEVDFIDIWDFIAADSADTADLCAGSKALVGIAIMHGSRNPRVMASILRSREEPRGRR